MTRIPSLTWWSAGINLAGALAVVYGLWHVAPRIAPWVIVLMLAGLAAWAGRTLTAALRRPETDPAAQSASSRLSRVVAAAVPVALALTGGITAVPTQGLGVALLVVAVLLATSDPTTPTPAWGAVAAVGALATAAGALLAAQGAAGPDGAQAGVLGFVAVLAALVLAIVGGLGRRAQRVLLIERARSAEDALRAQEAASRVAIARDLHDVLAHSLGGLVVQLDAAEALLEAGDADAAASRVAAARRLAADGLDEAREAVRTLREPGRPEPAAPPSDAIDPTELGDRLQALLTAHEAIGGSAGLGVTGRPRPVPPALADALVRTVQEGLSNARKHAPGSVVRIRILWHPDRVECVVENRIGSDVPAGAPGGELASTGGGYGLRGVRERFAALGGTASAGVEPGGLFTLRAEAPA